MFADYAKIYLKAGDGGNGAVAFRREKFIPLGGPSGGDGGRGGHILFRGNSQLTTLTDFKYQRHYKAERGGNGLNKNMSGKWGADMLLEVPCGTVIRDESGQILADIIADGQEYLAAKGGRGGRGNIRFSNEKDKAARYAEKGEPGQEITVILELKLIADVGLVGLPNAGKSTLLSRVSAAQPKIADYPFTTLEPNLGVVDVDESRRFVLADLPGLIEGAASGVGLGHRFLRHAERNRLLIHVVDVSGLTERSAVDSFQLINDELRLYREDFLSRPMVVAANKTDMPDSAAALAELRAALPEYEIFPISALTGEGVQALLYRVADLLEQAPPVISQPVEEEVRYTVVREEEPFVIRQEEPGYWVVEGQRVEKLVRMTDLNNDDAVLHMQRIFIKMGLEDALRKAGVQPGDTVSIADDSFEYAE